MRTYLEFIMIALILPIMGVSILIFCIFIMPDSGMSIASLVFTYIIFIIFFVLMYKVFKKDYIEIYRAVLNQECFLFLIVNNDSPTEVLVWARTTEKAVKKVKRKYPTCYINNITKIPYDNQSLFK